MLKFFTVEEESRLIEAIRLAEEKTSGEIRVHLEDEPKRPLQKDAIRIFRRLGMHRTRDRNGILILLAPERREFMILGDAGIDAKVADNFWDSERDLMQDHFRQQRYCEGLVQVIGHIGDKLKAFFPIQADDENELPNEISYGANGDRT